MPRKSLSVRRRFEVLQRDGFRCRYCGRLAPHVELHIDHVVPVADGGTNAIENLVAACRECNAGKSDRPLLTRLPEGKRGHTLNYGPYEAHEIPEMMTLCRLTVEMERRFPELDGETAWHAAQFERDHGTAGLSGFIERYVRCRSYEEPMEEEDAFFLACVGGILRGWQITGKPGEV